MNAPDIVKRLVEDFDSNRDFYHSQNYDEAKLRVHFLNPLFEALGWNIAESRKTGEVVYEDAIKIQGRFKYPDYGFCLGGSTRFFVEAKKPWVPLDRDPKPAYQVRRYGWNAKLPVSVLSDFEEFCIYDCRVPPDISDSPRKARLDYITFRDYIDQWDKLYGLFSRSAVAAGELNKLVGQLNQRGTVEVDTLFLRDMDEWRLRLARDLILHNPDLVQRDLNMSVQLILDRIIFLRICEDRGIEPFYQLNNHIGVSNGEAYQSFMQLCLRADAKYNSGLFHFVPEPGREVADNLTPNLIVGDGVLRYICSKLYYPDCPYEFSVIPADILGQAYERFLGKIIEILPDSTIDVVEKPEVRKAGGVYYTPTCIVDYIVQGTLSRLLQNKTLNEVSKLKLVDPACGSGAFLIQAYNYLLNWYLDAYLSNPSRYVAAGKLRTFTVPDGETVYVLTIHEKKRILLNHIYGLDLDQQAVEVTKLSLLLKVLEGESSETLQLKLFADRVLPDLATNICWGNSLIDTTYFEKNQSELDNLEALYSLKPFDWTEENGFRQIMNQGGFDAVIGNPPWGANFSPSQVHFLTSTYVTASKRSFDSYILFVERALCLLKQGGLFGLITPDTFLRKENLASVRKFLLKSAKVHEFVETGPMFPEVRDTWCLITLAERYSPSEVNHIYHKKISRHVVSVEERLLRFSNRAWDMESTVEQQTWLDRPDMIIGYLASTKEQELIAKIEHNPRLSELSEKFVISRGEEGSKFTFQKDPAGDFSMVIPANVDAFSIGEGTPVSSTSLTPTKINALYTHPKLWVIRIQKMRWKQRIVCAFDDRSNTCGMKTLQIIVSSQNNSSDLKFLEALLMSPLMNFWCMNYLTDDINQTYLGRVPIKYPSNEDMFLYKAIVEHVDKVRDLHTQITKTENLEGISILKALIAKKKHEINAFVYQLYSLTEDEIQTVENCDINET